MVRLHFLLDEPVGRVEKIPKALPDEPQNTVKNHEDGKVLTPNFRVFKGALNTITQQNGAGDQSERRDHDGGQYAKVFQG